MTVINPPPGGGGAVTKTAVLAAVPGLRAWNPAAYQGTYAAGTTYAYGDAVRALDGPDWKLYISLIDSNTGHNPVGDTGHWADTVALAAPVVVRGSADPNTDGEQSRITYYTQGATGGTFDLGLATGIAFSASVGTIQTALDNAYAPGVYKADGLDTWPADTAVATGHIIATSTSGYIYQAAGNFTTGAKEPALTGAATVSDNGGTWNLVGVVAASRFVVEYYRTDGTALVFSGTNLTGGSNHGTAVDQQSQIKGGFIASDGSIYLDNSFNTRINQFNSGLWSGSLFTTLTSARDFSVDAQNGVSRAGQGVGDITTAHQAVRGGKGSGSASVDGSATRDGGGQGDAVTNSSASVSGAGGNGTASVMNDASIGDGAAGNAISQMSAVFNTGTVAKVVTTGDSSGAYVGDGDAAAMGNSGKGFKIGSLAVDPTLATPEQIYRAFVDSGRFVDGS